MTPSVTLSLGAASAPHARTAALAAMTTRRVRRISAPCAARRRLAFWAVWKSQETLRVKRAAALIDAARALFSLDVRGLGRSLFDRPRGERDGGRQRKKNRGANGAPRSQQDIHDGGRRARRR